MKLVSFTQNHQNQFYQQEQQQSTCFVDNDKHMMGNFVVIQCILLAMHIYLAAKIRFGKDVKSR